VELVDAVLARRMVRDFDGRPVDPALVDRLLDLARRAPSAGNSQGTEFLVLEGEAATGWWERTLPADRREGFAFPGLVAAPVVVVPVGVPAAYVARYGEPDKAPTGLGAGADAWSVPFWLVDTAFATMTLLLAATDAGLGALFYGLFGREAAAREAYGIPHDHQPIGAVALGWPGADARPGRSAGRGRRPLEAVVHRGRWSG
jgi:nitroreductase